MNDNKVLPIDFQTKQNKENAVKRTRRRADRDPLPYAGADVAHMALRTQSLKQTAENCVVREVQVCFELGIANAKKLIAIERALLNRTGFGGPIVRREPMSVSQFGQQLKGVA